ncbi:MAG: CFI-box-CTERM domain-containing protein [Candidatus Hodarchaeota archaeon]
MKPTLKAQIASTILSISLLLLLLFPPRLAASSLTLAWSPNTEPDLAGYKVYYGTRSRDYDSSIDVSNVTQYTVTDLEPEPRYYFALTAYDFSGYESDFSAEVSAIPGALSSSAHASGGGGGGGSGCFIATAAYGSSLNPHVNILRDLKDEFLFSNSLGRKFVHLYYRYGPRIADTMGKDGLSTVLTRHALLPMIGISWLSLRTTSLAPSPQNQTGRSKNPVDLHCAQLLRRGSRSQPQH